MQEAKELNPDYIMHDSFAVWGKIIAQNLRLPAISFITTYAHNKRTFLAFPELYMPILKTTVKDSPKLFYAYGIYTLLATKHKAILGGPGEIMICKEKLNIVFTVPSLQPKIKTFAKTFKFVGPSIRPRNIKDGLNDSFSGGKKIIYISYGTVINDDISFFKKCVRAFTNTDYNVVISLGNKFEINEIPDLPKNIIVKKYIDQLSILQKASLFITHAGMNSVTESLYFGVPMILIPDTDEQRFNALSVERAGAGVILEKKNLTAQILFETSNHVLRSSQIIKKAKAIQKEFQEAGGYKEAVKSIYNFLQLS